MSPRSLSQTLLEPITADAPCGENLEDTPLLASFDTFRLFGQTTPLDPPPEWGTIKQQASEALARSKDLRLLAHLATALLRTDGIDAFSEALQVASQWLDGYWAATHPQITDDIVLRRNALNCFADQMAVIDGLRRTPLVSSRQHGTFSLRDVEIASGQLQPREGEARPDAAQVNAAFAEMPTEDLRRLHGSVTAGLAALRGIDARMRDAAGSEASPAFDPLSGQLSRIEKVVAAQLALRPGSAVAAASGSPPVQAAAHAVGAIHSRQDAVLALDAVAEFFRHTEPSSPIPLFLARAKRLVSKDFLEVLADVAPDAVEQARAAGGLRRSD